MHTSYQCERLLGARHHSKCSVGVHSFSPFRNSLKYRVGLTVILFLHLRLRDRKISSFQSSGQDPLVPTVPSTEGDYRVNWGLTQPSESGKAGVKGNALKAMG